MATAVYSTSLLYPVVHEIDEDEYETCCCVDGTVMSRLSLQGFPMPLSNVNPALERSESDQSNASSKSKPDKRSLFQAKRRRSAVQRARSEGALIDVSDTQTISTEAEDKKFEEAFVLTRQIFRCNSSVLWECVHRESGQRYCVKIFDRRGLGSAQEQESIQREIGLLLQAQTNDVGITQVLEVIDESDKVYLIMELMTGGNLLSRVVQQEGLSENTVKLVAKSLLLGVRHLHALDICHNGLEPSNILLDSMDGAKIGDFGYASRMGCKAAGAPETAAYKCQYTAPEVLEGDVPNAASDMWSVGVMLYFCLFGQMPFCDQSDVTSINNPSGRTRTVVSRIHKADYSFQFPLAEWNDVDIDVSRYAKQLISSLIHMDPTVRLTADEALEHPWFADANADPADEHEYVRGRGHLNRRRRPRIIGTLAKCFWENIGSLCRKKNKDVKQVVFASLSTNSSTPYSDYASMNMNVNMNTRHRREESTSSSMNRFYDIGA